MVRRNSESSSSPPVRHAPLPSSGERMRKYKGVRLRKWGSWVSEIRLPNSRERIWLGSHATPEKAARAFDAAYICLRGLGGRADALNFPDSPPPDVGRRTSDPQEVYAAAVSHANRAAAAAGPSAEPTPQSTQANGGGRSSVETAAAVVPSPAPSLLEVSITDGDDGSFDWFANPPPLYSPTPTMVVERESHASEKASEADVDMEENESGSSCPGLWCFDSDDAEF